MINKDAIFALLRSEFEYSMRKRRNHLMSLAAIIITLFFIIYTYLAGGLSEVFTGYLYVKDEYLWTILLYSSALFLYLLGIFIGADVFPHDIEEGYVDTLYTLPSTRIDLFIGKLVGGYLSLITYIMIIEAIIATTIYIIFQVSIDFIILLGITSGFALASLVFYTISIYLGIRMRSWIHVTLFSLSILLISPFTEYLLYGLGLSNYSIIEVLSNLLPHRPLEIPISIVYSLIEAGEIPKGLIDPVTGLIIIALYTLVFTSISASKFIEADFI